MSTGEVNKATFKWLGRREKPAKTEVEKEKLFQTASKSVDALLREDTYKDNVQLLILDIYNTQKKNENIENIREALKTNSSFSWSLSKTGSKVLAYIKTKYISNQFVAKGYTQDIASRLCDEEISNFFSNKSKVFKCFYHAENKKIFEMVIFSDSKDPVNGDASKRIDDDGGDDVSFDTAEDIDSKGQHENYSYPEKKERLNRIHIGTILQHFIIPKNVRVVSDSQVGPDIKLHSFLDEEEDPNLVVKVNKALEESKTDNKLHLIPYGIRPRKFLWFKGEKHAVLLVIHKGRGILLDSKRFSRTCDLKSITALKYRTLNWQLFWNTIDCGRYCCHAAILVAEEYRQKVDEINLEEFYLQLKNKRPDINSLNGKFKEAFEATVNSKLEADKK